MAHAGCSVQCGGIRVVQEDSKVHLPRPVRPSSLRTASQRPQAHRRLPNRTRKQSQATCSSPVQEIRLVISKGFSPAPICLVNNSTHAADIGLHAGGASTVQIVIQTSRTRLLVSMNLSCDGCEALSSPSALQRPCRRGDRATPPGAVCTRDGFPRGIRTALRGTAAAAARLQSDMAGNSVSEVEARQLMRAPSRLRLCRRRQVTRLHRSRKALMKQFPRDMAWCGKAAPDPFRQGDWAF